MKDEDLALLLFCGLEPSRRKENYSLWVTGAHVTAATHGLSHSAFFLPHFPFAEGGGGLYFCLSLSLLG